LGHQTQTIYEDMKNGSTETFFGVKKVRPRTVKVLDDAPIGASFKTSHHA
jgi:hypothetical protein